MKHVLILFLLLISSCAKYPKNHSNKWYAKQYQAIVKDRDNRKAGGRASGTVYWHTDKQQKKHYKIIKFK